MEAIIKQAHNLLTAMRQQARYRDTVPEKLVHTYALLYTLMTTVNPYRVTNIFGEQFLSTECYPFLRETVDCDEDELDSYLGFLQDNDLVEIVDASSFYEMNYIAVKEAPVLDVDE